MTASGVGPVGVHAVGDDQHVFAREGGIQDRAAGDVQGVAQRRVAVGGGKVPGKVLQRRRIKRPELDRLPARCSR